ncbi:MAG: hypothetical protein FWG45_02370 [Oscillospiraceae bacterium]|nr:hypothetical protein [Oscillospiraceae bacterium]
MKKNFLRALSMLLSAVILTQSFFAGNPNVDGGGGGLRRANRNNGWVVSSRNNDFISTADGLRTYIVNATTGRPVTNAIDITNYNIATSNIVNYRQKTKFDYKHVSSALNFTTTYSYINPTTPLPRIVSSSMSGGSSASRVEAIREWFSDINHFSWVVAQFGFTPEELSSNGYKLALEPMAYFRYESVNYAMTATEAALFDQLSGGSLNYRVGALTRQNLPLAIFLETDEFVNSEFRINAWTGTRTSRVPNEDIIRQLGIGYVNFFSETPRLETEGGASFAYPTDTWVVTPFRLANVQHSGGNWIESSAITSRNPATATITINGTRYSIPNIYIPAGGEQLVWVKWKTPSTPRTLTATATSTRGYFFNRQNTGTANRYASTINATIEIYDNDMESEPPDPTLDDTQQSIGYAPTNADNTRRGMTSSGNPSGAWYVWDCNVVQVDGEYHFEFHKIMYRAEISGGNVNLTPDFCNPTAYTRNYQTFMKSGYGVNISTDPFIRITVTHERTGATSTNTYHSATATNYATAPQYVSVWFREFGYQSYNRQLEQVNNRFVFRRNRFSTYNSRVHYTPWWLADGTNYDVIASSDNAYTPAGRLTVLTASNPLVIEGVFMDDWHIAATR